MSKVLLSLLAILAISGPVYGACTPATMSCNSTVTGRLENGDCLFFDGSYYDRWMFQGTAGQVVTIDMTSSALDNYLVLLDPAENPVAEADEGGTGAPERITFTLGAAGTWTIIANSYDAGEVGNYNIALACGGANACTPSGTPLLVNNNRYRVRFCAVAPNGAVAQGTPTPQTNLFGWFSLPTFTGDAGNPEVFAKVLGPVNGVPWVFYAGLTNLAFTMTVEDTATGQNRTYSKPTPPPGSFQSYGDFDVNQNVSQQCSNVIVSNGQTGAGGGCANSSSALCLLNRFRVTLSARDNPTRSNNTGSGVTLPVNTTFGFFSIPALSNDATNIEAFVKMVDGRLVNNKYWVFLGGLTDFELTISVTDTVTGAQKIYQKPAGSTCGWNDTNAF